MKHLLASISYLLFMVLFGMQFLSNSSVLLSTRYVLFIIALYFLFQNLISENAANIVRTYGFLYIGAVIVFLVYSVFFPGPLFGSLVLYFLVAAILGFAIAAFTNTKKAMPAPVKPVSTVKKIAVKTTAPKAAPAKKTTKKVVRKTAKTATKKKVAKNKADDLTKIEGIGPAIKRILSRNGIKTYNDLAKAKVGDLRALLARAGDKYKLHNPRTWPQQARLAKAGKWVELGKLQEKLDGGLKTTKRTAAKKAAKKTTRKSAKKTSKKKVAKKAAKRTTKKATKKSAKKATRKKVAKKKVAKKSAKKSTRRKARR